MNTFKPILSLDEYIDNNELNMQMYGVLLLLQDGDSNRYKLKLDILYVFNKIYELCYTVKTQKYPEQFFYNDWNSIRSNHTSYETSIIFSGAYVILSLQPKTVNNLNHYLSRAKNKIDPIYFEVFEPILINGKAYNDNRTLPPDFSFLKSEADKIENLDERELYYQEYATRYKQAKNQGDILEQIADEIKLIERTKTLSTPTTSNVNKDDKPLNTNPKNNTFTTAQQVLFFYYFFNEIKINFSNTDKAQWVRFINTFTGKNAQDIKEKLNFDFSSPKIKKDLSKVAGYISELMPQIAVKIKNDIQE